MRSRSLTLLALALALLGASAAVAHRMRVAAEKPYDVAFVPSAASLRWTSLGHPTLAANLMWLRAVQYMGEARADRRGWSKLRPIVELVTDLDPRHGYAYQTSANLLSSAGLLSDSNAILEKGTRNVPTRYILPFQRAVNAFMYAGDYAEAGRWFEVAAKTPGAPAHLREYVMAMYVKGDAAEAALSFLGRMEVEAEDDESRRAIHAQIQRATLERDAGVIEQAAQVYAERHAIRPFVPEQLVFEGLLAAVPPDPFGGTYYFGEDGRVRSTAYEKRYERPPTAAERNRELRESRARIREYERSSR